MPRKTATSSGLTHANIEGLSLSKPRLIAIGEFGTSFPTCVVSGLRGRLLMDHVPIVELPIGSAEAAGSQPMAWLRCRWRRYTFRYTKT
jgi:hypothetical protein